MCQRQVTQKTRFHLYHFCREQIDIKTMIIINHWHWQAKNIIFCLLPSILNYVSKMEEHVTTWSISINYFLLGNKIKWILIEEKVCFHSLRVNNSDKTAGTMHFSALGGIPPAQLLTKQFSRNSFNNRHILGQLK